MAHDGRRAQQDHCEDQEDANPNGLCDGRGRELKTDSGSGPEQPDEDNSSDSDQFLDRQPRRHAPLRHPDRAKADGVLAAQRAGQSHEKKPFRQYGGCRYVCHTRAENAFRAANQPPRYEKSPAFNVDGPDERA